ncbi:hypothetical protein E4T56_gene12049, partial [Termitomyces sp. T112]
MDKTAHIARPPLQVDQHIADPLARPMIGIFAAPPGLHHLETRIEHVGNLRAGARRIDRGMFEQPDQVGGRPFMDRIVARGLKLQRLAIGDRIVIPPDGHTVIQQNLGFDCILHDHDSCVGQSAPLIKRQMRRSNMAWRTAHSAILANRDVLLAMAGVFFLLPRLAFALLMPEPPSAQGMSPAQSMQAIEEFYTRAMPYMIPMILFQA